MHQSPQGSFNDIGPARGYPSNPNVLPPQQQQPLQQMPQQVGGPNPYGDVNPGNGVNNALAGLSLMGGMFGNNQMGQLHGMGQHQNMSQIGVHEDKPYMGRL